MRMLRANDFFDEAPAVVVYWKARLGWMVDLKVGAETDPEFHQARC